MLRKGMFLADRYEIIEQIGTGGMSDVYKAKCHKLNRYVAIKVMKEEFSHDKNFVSKFIIEAQSAAGLTHPNVVSVYDVGDENGIYYIVMEKKHIYSYFLSLKFFYLEVVSASLFFFDFLDFFDFLVAFAFFVSGGV